jgi:hypothetical protein
VLESNALPLHPQDASNLHDEMRALYHKYAALQDPTAKDYYVLGLVLARL